MAAGSIAKTTLAVSSVRRPLRDKRAADRWLLLSFSLSLFLHGAGWLAYRHYANQPEQHVFILLNSGEQAMEVSTGGSMAMAPSPAKLREEVSEKRPELEKADLEKQEKPILEEPEPEKAPEPVRDDMIALRAPLTPDRDGVFSKPPIKRRKKEQDVPERPEPPKVQPDDSSSAFTPASVATGGNKSKSVGVRQRAKPAGEGFSLIYPESARELGETGIVEIEAEISSGGECLSAVVTSSSGYHTLDMTALDAVRGARYHPAQQDGSPVISRERFEIVFELADAL